MVNGCLLNTVNIELGHWFKDRKGGSERRISASQTGCLLWSLHWCPNFICTDHVCIPLVGAPWLWNIGPSFPALVDTLTPATLRTLLSYYRYTRAASATIFAFNKEKALQCIHQSIDVKIRGRLHVKFRRWPLLSYRDTISRLGKKFQFQFCERYCIQFINADLYLISFRS